MVIYLNIKNYRYLKTVTSRSLKLIYFSYTAALLYSHTKEEDHGVIIIRF